MAGRIVAQVGDDGGPTHYEGAVQNDTTVVLVPLCDPGMVRLNGRELDGTSLPVVRANASATYHAKTALRGSLVVLPGEVFRTTNRFEPKDMAVLQGLNGVLPVDPNRIKALRSLMLRFAAIQDPLTVSAGRVLEEEFMAHIFAAVGSRSKSPNQERGRPWISREQVLRKVRDLIASAADEVLHVEDLCRATGVSERTLRTVFNQSYGIGPLRYLTQRRMHLVRAALRQAALGRDTVASIAAEFGFWEFGRFAREYKALFGELPSQTLWRVKHDGIVFDRGYALTASGADR
jgi:AraC family transcriptional regulator, ethanolamine operon transcriptional activator